MKFSQYIKMYVAMLSLLLLGGCGPVDKEKKGRAPLKEIVMEYQCFGLTHDERDLICGTLYGGILSVNPYTGESSTIYNVNRKLGALAYMGNGKYLFERTDEHNNHGFPYSFDIHKDLKSTLTRQMGTYSRGGMVYDQAEKLVYGTNGGYINVSSLDGKFSDEIYGSHGGNQAMAQTDKYIYTITDYGLDLVQFSKDEIAIAKRGDTLHYKVIPYNQGYFDMDYGIEGMTIFRGDIFIYFRGDGMIHKLDVNLLDYDDSVNVKMRT